MTAAPKPPAQAKPQTVQQQQSPAAATTPVAQATSAPAANVSPQGEVTETTKSGADNTTQTLDQTWDEEAVVNSILRGEHFQPNSANEYNNLAYHWKLFCLPDKDYAYDGGVATSIQDIYQRIDATNPQITIAETGVSGYNIGEVVMKTVAAEVSSRGAVMTEITMKINEPNGVSFLDSLQTAAEAAGVTNYLDFPYFLQLSFRGYNQNGGYELNPFAELPNGGRWLWAVSIKDIDVQLGSGGGSYKLSMLPASQQPWISEYGTTIDTMSIKAKTVGDFFDQLGEKMSNSWKARMFVKDLGKEGFITHKFAIHGIAGNGNAPTSQEQTQNKITQLQKVADANKATGAKGTKQEVTDALDTANTENTASVLAGNGISADAIRKMTLVPQDDDYHDIRGELGFDRPDGSGSSPNKESAGAGIPTACVPRGAIITDIVNMLFGVVEPAQNMAKDSHAQPDGSPDDSADQINAKGFRECVTWQVIPEVQFKNDDYLKYDYLTNRYGRIITWHIYPRIDQEPVLSRLQIEQAFGDKASGVQKKMLAALAKRGFLPKRYDYLFTGLNTEVLNFDLGFNFAWSVNLPRFEAYYNQQRLPQALVSADKILLSYADLNAKKQDKYNDVYNENQELKKLQQPGQTGGQNSAANPELANKLQKDVNQLYALNAQADVALAQGQKLRDQAEAAGKAALSKVPGEQDYQREFVENILAQQRQNPTQSATMRRIPFSWSAGDEAKQDAGLGAHGQWHLGRQLYGAILNQVYSPVTSRFIQADMTIRGDPFWIGQGTFEDTIDHNLKVMNDLDQRKLAYQMQGQQCFLFRFKYPVGADDSGEIILKDNETVTGIYKVTNITNTFSGGQFTQELHGIRLPLFDVFKSILGIQDNSDNQGTEADKQAKKPTGS